MERARGSASGPTAGSSLVSPLSISGVSYSDRQWTDALRWRLGFTAQGPAGHCQNEQTGAGEMCGEILDPEGTHAVDCPRGPLRTRRHDLADVYGDILEESGAIARRKAFVLELSSAQGAWLDVRPHGLQEFPD